MLYFSNLWHSQSVQKSANSTIKHRKTCKKRAKSNAMKVTIKLDKRHQLKNGKYPLKYRIARKGTAMYIPTGLELGENEWDEKNCKVKNRTDKNQINLRLLKRLGAINEKIETLREEGKLRLYTNKSLVAYINGDTGDEDAAVHLFKTQLTLLMQNKNNRTTVYIYGITERKMKEFCDYDHLLCEDIDVTWLDGFVQKLRNDGNTQNSIAMRLRNIRAVLNYARQKGLLSEYAFSQYKIKTTETEKRSLSVEQLRTLYHAELPQVRARHRDVFFLVFFLMGINMVDLSGIGCVEDGRIKYRRAKTGTLYDIKVEPEAQAIIDKYRGKEHLLSMFDKVSAYRIYMQECNNMLSKISKQLGLPEITVYWARHTFATIAYQLDIPTDIIADCLGHKSAHRITQIYIAKDLNKVDAANRKVIDYVLYGKK